MIGDTKTLLVIFSLSIDNEVRSTMLLLIYLDFATFSRILCPYSTTPTIVAMDLSTIGVIDGD